MTSPPDFAEFVRLRSSAILRSAWVLTGGDWALAEDLAQTALGEVWRRWDRVAAMEAPGDYDTVFGTEGKAHFENRTLTMTPLFTTCARATGS